MVVLLAVPLWAADPIPAGPSFKVNTGQQYPTDRPDVAAGDAGNFVVVWQGGSGDYAYPLFSRAFDAAGAPAGPIAMPGPDNMGTRSAFPSVAASSAGDFVTTWLQGSGSYAVDGQRGDAAGTLLGGNFTVASGIGDYFYQPAVAAAADGDFVVVWGDENTYDTADVFGRRYDSSGAPQGAAFAVKAETTLDSHQPIVAADASGAFVVVWADGYPPSDLRGQRFDSAGAAVGPELAIASGVSAGQYAYGPEHAVAMSATGDFVVVWRNEPPGAHPLQAQRFDGSGAAVGGVLSVTGTNPGPVESADVAMDDDGDFVVTWGDGSDVFGRRFDASAGSMGEIFAVNDFTSSFQRDPALAMDAAGSFVVAWAGYGDDPDYPGLVNAGVFARRFLVPEDVGIAAVKLIVVDRVAISGKAKLVYVAKNEPGIAKGAGGDPAALSGRFDVFYTDAPSSVAGSFVLPAPWRTAKDTVAKYVNSLAPSGPGQVKVAVVKDGIAAKVRAKGLGDGPALDLFVGPPSASGGVTTVLQVVNLNDGSARRLCTRFATDLGSSVDYRLLAQGGGRKLVAKNGVPAACP